MKFKQIKAPETSAEKEINAFLEGKKVKSMDVVFIPNAPMAEKTRALTRGASLGTVIAVIAYEESL